MTLISHATPQQIELLTLEPSMLYRPQGLTMPARFALCSRLGDSSGRMQQDLYEVSQLDWVMRQVSKMPARDRRHFWISQATLMPGAVNRRISSIILLNALWVDIDINHPPAGFDINLNPGPCDGKKAEHQAVCLAFQIEDAGLPPPSYIVATGGGLCPKWIFESGIPAQARPRWQSLQKTFVDRVAAISWTMGEVSTAWPVDRRACDAARILRLVGSHNPRWSEECRIVWESGKTYDFEYLANEFLPYTRQDVEDFRVSKNKWKAWDKNREIAAKAGIRSAINSVQNGTLASLEDEAARSLWSARFEFGRAVLTARGPVQVGDRNNFFWPMATALAWSCSSVDDINKEIKSLYQSHFSSTGWKPHEANQAAASVMQRLKKKDLYKMKTATFLEHLDVSGAELRIFGEMLGSSRHNLNRSSWSHGDMGFERMKDLPVKDYIAETKRRQALAGARSAQARVTTYDVEKHARARQMALTGLSSRTIAAALGVAQTTVARWLRD